jgi:hypothetical protein
MNITQRDAHYLILTTLRALALSEFGQSPAVLECLIDGLRLSVADTDGIVFYNLKINCSPLKQLLSKRFLVVTASENPTILEDVFR